MRRKLLRKVVWFLLAACAIYLGVCYVLARSYVSPFRRIPQTPPYASDLNVTTRYGPTPAWVTAGLANHKASKVVFVLAHGYGGSRETWSQTMADLKSKGFDSVAVSMPGQDASPLRSVGFGKSEEGTIVDTVTWVRATAGRPVRVVVLGVSMGGAAAWMAGAEDPSIDGIITEGAFARFDEAMNGFFECKIRGGSVVCAPVVMFARMMTGLDPKDVRPIDQAKLWHGKPALVIQAASDSMISRSHAERLSQAVGCPLWVVPGADHAQCYEVAGGEYLNRLVSFASNLDRPKAADR